jgi:ATP-dependent DNA helicase HFM1/MER3
MLLTSHSQISKGQMKLKERKSSHSDQEDVEVIDLAEELPPVTDTDLAPRDYRKLQSLHTTKENEKPVRLPKQKPGFSYASAQQPNLPFLRKPKTDDDMFDSWEFAQEEDFPSPSALTKGEGNSSDPFEIDLITHEKATPTSSMRDGSLESLEAAMLGLDDSERLKTPTPKIDLNFENGVFNFSAFNDQPEQREIFSSPSMQTSLKRPLSLTPEMPEMKYRRVKKDESTTKDPMITQIEPIEHKETQQRTVPPWVDEFDSALINDLKGIVDFVD